MCGGATTGGGLSATCDLLDGTSGARTTLTAYAGEKPVLDFSGESDGSRGLQLNASYWHLYGLTVQHLVDTAWTGLDRTGPPPRSAPLPAEADEYAPV